MNTARDLEQMLAGMDGRSYPAYKDTRGAYRFPRYILSIDHVQGDPFAAPSKVSVYVSGKEAAFPPKLYQMSSQKKALQDQITRLFGEKARACSGMAKGSGHSGLIATSRCGQEILERTACRLEPKDGSILLRLEVGFPARGRTIDARGLRKILFEWLPKCVEQSMMYKNLDAAYLQSVADLAEDQQYLREMLPKLDLCAFVANGSILPRASGVSSLPMKDSVPFSSPKELEVTIELPHRGKITGMGIPKGITLIVGGGYHGKSTLLKALEHGVYSHKMGDGREYVITDSTAVKLRAEDGRSIRCADISMFINHLPNGVDTTRFDTEDASGSTSQAANVVEAMEAGSTLLLMDEDTSATNFMIRDELMQRVIHCDMEPITPFLERIEELYYRYGVSTVLVAGSSGAYFHVAHCIIQMDQYLPKDITARAKEEASKFPSMCTTLNAVDGPNFHRVPKPLSEFRRGERVKIKSMGRDGVSINRETIDLRGVEQLVDGEQVSALGYCLLYAQRYLMDGRRTMREIVEMLEQRLEQEGLEVLWENSSHVSFVARPRKQEILACLNRYRGLKLE